MLCQVETDARKRKADDHVRREDAAKRPNASASGASADEGAKVEPSCDPTTNVGGLNKETCLRILQIIIDHDCRYVAVEYMPAA